LFAKQTKRIFIFVEVIVSPVIFSFRSNHLKMYSIDDASQLSLDFGNGYLEILLHFIFQLLFEIIN
jgi:hypothetical protein